MGSRQDKVTTFKIFVKNLAGGTSVEELKSVFEAYGRIAEVHIFRSTFAFVHMEEEAAGRNAMLMLNAKMLNGKCIGVEESKQKDGPSVPSTRLRIHNVPPTMSAQDLRTLFCKYGIILAAEINNDKGVVTIEAIADIRSAISDMNGYQCEGADQALIVEPIINSAISYSPKSRPTPVYSPVVYHPPSSPYAPRRMHRPPPSIGGYFPGRMKGPSLQNPEGRVLRDPYAQIPRVPQMMMQRPQHCFVRNPQTRFRPPIQAAIEPLFFKRNEIMNGNPATLPPNFYEDDSLNTLGSPVLIDPYANNVPPPPPPLFSGFRQGPPSHIRPHLRPRFPMKRGLPEPEEGEPFQVPGMVPPGSFRPPKKYFANLPKRPKKKKRTEPRPQPPIPEQPQKLVPDFSSYYTIPEGAVLKPFPPPLNPDSDFSEDVSI